MTESPITLPPWPGGATIAISLTFDVDAESSLLGRSSSYESRLTSLSEARYAVVRGLPRILEILASYEALATFYVPGLTAERHPDAVEAVVAAGHEIAHHGHMHLRSHEVDADTQRREIEDGIEAITRVLGEAPTGYRSPGWELTPHTVALLDEYNFRYDSSAMGDDRPYFLDYENVRLLELPVHWSLDDVPFFGFSGDLPARLGDPGAMWAAWAAEFESARRDSRYITFTMHPEIIGRGYRAEGLRTFLDDITRNGDTWIGRHADVAELILRRASLVDAT